MPGKGLSTNVEDMEQMQPALQLALYLIDKVPRIRLSKEAKGKALKKRKAVAEQFMKLSHKQRQEAAMLRKEAGDDLEAIQSLLEHSSLAITQIYLHKIEGKQDTSWSKVEALLGL